ncbi:MAG TPA: LOG family protein [Candidatus Acidoferrales bacterium]|nr:LOG family protein [Candidatus Acidoferrales bacterium]
MKRHARIVTVFGSSRPQPDDELYTEAQALGVALAERGFSVCTGGYSGVMEAVSRGAKQAGGRTIGITARFFRSRANPWIDEEIRVATWQDRLFELIERGHGYVACPGGTGTLVELAIVWEMLNKGAMKKKPVTVFGDFWRPVIERVREAERTHSSRWLEREQSLIHVALSPRDAAEHLSRCLVVRSRPR